MKTSLAHLPEEKQLEIQRIVEIIKEVMSPEMIILFGSYAKGKYVENRYHAKDGIEYEYISDYDILVVTNNNSEKSYVQEGTIMDRVSRYRPPVNLEIHELDYINKGLEDGEYFFVDIIKEGILLHNKNGVQFSTPKELTTAEKKGKADRYFKTWFPQASEFIFGAEAFQQRGNLKTATFLLHQATESLYYTALLVFTDYKPKTHNLWKLRKKAKPHSIDLHQVFKAEVDKNEERLFELLKRGYVDARYRMDFQISSEDLSILIHRVKVMVPIVEEIAKQKISSFD